MAIEKISRVDPVYSYFTFNEKSGRSSCLTCGIAIKGKNMTNLKYHLKDKHSKEYVHMISECEKRDNQIQQFFEFNEEIGKSKCITCGIFIQGNKLLPMKIHLIRHCKEKADLREDELILQPAKPMELQNNTPSESSNLVQPKDSEISKILKRCPANDVKSPLLKEPFKEGWRREIVYRAFVDPNNPIFCDVYYHTPEGKKLRSARELLNYLDKVKSTFTLENFTFSKQLIGVGSQETLRNANPRSHKLPSSETAKRTIHKMKIQRRTYKLRRTDTKRKTLKTCEKKLQRKFKKDQALRVRQEKLQKNLHKLQIRQEKLQKNLLKLGVDKKTTALPLNLPLTAPIYLPLGTTLVFSDPSSIEIKYSGTDDSYAIVDQGLSGLHGRPDTSSNLTTADASSIVLDESNFDEQCKNHSAPASSSLPVVPSCSTSVISQPAIIRQAEKPGRNDQTSTQSFNTQSLPESPSSFLEHLGLISNGKPFFLRRAAISEDSTQSPVQLQEQMIPIASSVIHQQTSVCIVRKQPDGPLADPLESYDKQSQKRPRIPLIEID